MKRINISVIALIALILVGIYRTPNAIAQPVEGTLLSDLVIPGSSGVGVGFDGNFLYWLDFGGATLHQITTGGAFAADIPIVGCTATVISWDASRNVFWGASDTQISQIATGGACTPQFNVAGNRPGDCDTGFCSELVDGINYDPADDSIWYSPDGSERVYHYDVTAGNLGALLGFFDVNDPPNDMVAECGFNFSSGVATGVLNVMYLAADGCSTIFKYDKSGTKLGSFAIGAQRHEDIECDNVTFAGQNTDAMWIKDAFDGHIRAFAVAKGTCVTVTEVDECLAVQLAAQAAVAGGGPYRNHGQLVSTAAQVVSPAEESGEITEECASCIMNQFARRIPIAEQTSCGIAVP